MAVRMLSLVSFSLFERKGEWPAKNWNKMQPSAQRSTAGEASLSRSSSGVR